MLEILRQSHNGRWKDVTDLGALVLQLCPIESAEGLDQRTVDEFAKDLAEACEALLLGFVTDTTALNQFYAEKPEEQAKFIDLFRTYSAPYLRRVQSLQGALADAHLEVALGISTINNRRDRVLEFKNEVVHPRQPHMQGLLKDLQFLDMKDDALVLFQEKIGVPLCYYQGLEGLGRLYDRSRRIKETHFDYPALRRRLPEIRQVDQDRQRVTAESLQNVLYGIMTRQIAFDGRDYVMARDQGGGPLDFPVGGHLADVVQYYAARDNTDDRGRLTDQVNAWLDQASRAPDATALAALWCALPVAPGRDSSAGPILDPEKRDGRPDPRPPGALDPGRPHDPQSKIPPRAARRRQTVRPVVARLAPRGLEPRARPRGEGPALGPLGRCGLHLF